MMKSRSITNVVSWSRSRCVPMTCLSAIAAATMLLAGCTSPGKAALETNVPLKRAPDLAGAATPGVLVWRAPDLAEHQRTLTSYYIPPATVYHGKGASFAGLTPAQADQVAATLTQDVTAAMRKRFKVVSQPGPGVFTLELILVKIAPPQIIHITNGPYEWSSTVYGNPNIPTMSAGVMTVSGKFIESATGTLLVEFVAPVSPQFMEMGGRPHFMATGAGSNPADAMQFAQIASRRFAADLVAGIERQREIGRAETSR